MWNSNIKIFVLKLLSLLADSFKSYELSISYLSTWHYPIFCFNCNLDTLATKPLATIGHFNGHYASSRFLGFHGSDVKLRRWAVKSICMCKVCWMHFTYTHTLRQLLKLKEYQRVDFDVDLLNSKLELTKYIQLHNTNRSIFTS